MTTVSSTPNLPALLSAGKPAGRGETQEAMKKYLQLAKVTFQEYLVYRLNFVLWRFRSFVFFLSLFFFWLSVYGDQTEFLGYQKSQIMAYIVGIAFLRSIVLASRSTDLAGQIRSGELTKLIIWPIKTIWYWFSRDLVDKSLNLFFTIFEVVLILKLFKFPFFLPQNLNSYFYFLILVIIAFFLYFFISFSLSIVAFWTDEVWSTRWLFGIIFLEFFAGAFFPIDVLPVWLTRIIYLTPFPYLVFFPLKVWLEQLSVGLIVRSILVSLFWLAFFYWLANFLWRKGSKSYEAYGG